MNDSKKAKLDEVEKIKSELRSIEKEIRILKSKLINEILITNQERRKFELFLRRKASELNIIFSTCQFSIFIKSLIRKVSLA